jgi:hypothetical protein
MDDAITPLVLLVGGIAAAIFFTAPFEAVPFAVASMVAVLGAHELGELIEGDEGWNF